MGAGFTSTGAGDGVRGQSTDGYGGAFSSITNYAGYFNGSNGIEITTTGSSGTAIQVFTGRFVGSMASVNDGDFIPDDVMIADISDFGGGIPAVNLPLSPTLGQILYTMTSDPDGATVSFLMILPSEVRMWIYGPGGWKLAP